MHIMRCPHCLLPATADECEKGSCPACGGSLLPVGPIAAEMPKQETPAPRRSPGGLFAWSGAVFLSGAVGGFLVGGDPFAEGQPAQASTPAATYTSQDVRVKELEAIIDKLNLALTVQKKQSLEESARAEAALNEAEQARTEGTRPDGRIKELDLAIEHLTKEIAVSKKNAAAAAARAEAAEREAELARAEARKPQADRLKTLETLAAKNLKELNALKKQLTDARAREDAARRITEQVRQQGQRVLEQLRQETQRTIEQLRQELNRQQQATQLARAEAMRFKQAAEEARRKK